MVEPIPGWIEHLNIYTAIALPPANNKSLVIRRATKPLVEWEQRQREELQPLIAQARSKRKSEERLIDHNRKAAVREPDAAARTKLMNEVAEQEANVTEIPVLPKLFTNDATPESLATSVAEQNGRFSIISDEGGYHRNPGWALFQWCREYRHPAQGDRRWGCSGATERSLLRPKPDS